MQVDAQFTLNDGVVDAGGTVDEVRVVREKPSSANRILVKCGRSSVIQPVSTAVMRMPSSSISLELVRVSMFSAALGHVGVRVARALVCAAELAFHGGDIHDVLASRSGRGHRRAQA